jgi:hypothetical protein
MHDLAPEVGCTAHPPPGFNVTRRLLYGSELSSSFCPDSRSEQQLLRAAHSTRLLRTRISALARTADLSEHHRSERTATDCDVHHGSAHAR